MGKTLVWAFCHLDEIAHCKLIGVLFVHVFFFLREEGRAFIFGAVYRCTVKRLLICKNCTSLCVGNGWDFEIL